MTDSKISWTTKTWNPTTGCDRVSPGCDHCYALTLAARLKGMGNPRYQNDGNTKTSGPGFALTLHHDKLDEPLRWKKPARVFVNSMSDLFHDDVPDQFIADVFATMAMASQHTFQVLTKRPRRMARFVARLMDNRPPLPNVWLGTSVEDQKRADLRIPHLLDTPAAVRFLSCEPLLGPVDLSLYLTARMCVYCAGKGTLPGNNYVTPNASGPPNCFHCNGSGERDSLKQLHWVIVGGESGPNYRPIDLEDARVLRDQCEEQGVPFFYKQGSGIRSEMHKELDGRLWQQMPDEPQGQVLAL